MPQLMSKAFLIMVEAMQLKLRVDSLIDRRLDIGEVIVPKFKSGGIIEGWKNDNVTVASINISPGELFVNKKQVYNLYVAIEDIPKCYRAKNTVTLKSFKRRRL